MISLDQLKVELFADGADLNTIRELAAHPLVTGFTTNPTLMRRAGVTDYVAFAHDVLETVADRPVSFEVFTDDFEEMACQAREIASWGPNVNVKIPVTDTSGQFAGPLISRLTGSGIQVNVTAILNAKQVSAVAECLSPDVPAFVSVFAGRIADSGRDPCPVMVEAVEMLAPLTQARLIWASPRELFNVFQADAAGCHVITATSDIFAKLPFVGKDLGAISKETVEMFHRDAAAAGYVIPLRGNAATE